MKKALSDPRFLWSSLILTFFILLAVFSNALTPYAYDAVNTSEALQAPHLGSHMMGTDILGRDLLSRVLFGARLSLAIGFFTALFALIVGTFTGALAGYFGGWYDRITLNLIDGISIFPMLLLAIILTLVVGRGFFGIFFAIALTTWVTQARLVRGLVLQAREMPYVEASRALGLTHLKIIYKHIIPNLWGPMIVSLSFQIPNNILTESFLSFIGLGLQPPYTSWGTLANEGFRGIQSYPHLIIFPGLALFITMLAFNFLGDALRDLLDPKSKVGSSVGH